MEETSDDENYYENFRALSETWDCETSDTDGEILLVYLMKKKKTNKVKGSVKKTLETSMKVQPKKFLYQNK